MAQRHVILYGFLFGALGFVANLVPVEVLPSAHALLGPLFVLPIAVLLGPWAGLIAAAIASVPTVWLWGHPFGLLNFVLEAVAVGYLSRRFRPLVADAIYWVTTPLYFYLTYHLIADIPGPITVVMAVKQAVNALFFVLVIEVALLLPALRRRLGTLLPAPVRDVSLSTAFMSLLTVCAVIPLLVLGAAEGRARYDVELARLAAENLRSAEKVRDDFERTVEHTVHATRAVAEMLAAEASSGALPPVAEMERALRDLVRLSPSIPAAYVGSPEGRAVAFFPTHNPAGKPLAGTDFSDRSYVKQLQTATEPVVSGIFQGRGGVSGPLIIVAAPIRRGDRYLGYVLSGLNIQKLRAEVAEAAKAAQATARAIVIDQELSVIADSGAASADRVETIRGSALADALARVRTAEGETYVAGPPHLWALRAHSLRHFTAVTLPSVNWKVVVEQSTEALQRRLERSYLALLLWIALALLIVVIVARALARSFVVPIEGVSSAAHRLAAGERTARAADVAHHAPIELRDLAKRFDEMASQLSRQLDQVESSAREKDAFLTIAAHELRTPLTSLKAQVQILGRQGATKITDERLQILNRQVDRLSRLIHQLMDVSQLSSGRLAMQPAAVDLSELARRTAEAVVATSELHQLSVDAEPLLGVYDEVRLEQLLHNLISNAIKYSPNGGLVEVSVKRAEDGAAVLRVADRGIGLGAAENASLFERFARGDTNELKGISGFGVGLYLSREIVRLHGGTIALHQRDGGGAIATVVLPPSPLPAPAGDAVHRHAG